MVYNSAETGVQYFDPTATQCSPATTFMRWTNSTVDNTDQMLGNLPITLFQQNPVAGVKAGYLGLNPNGDFFKYVQEKTSWGDNKDNVLFGLSLTPNSGASNLVNLGDKNKWKQNQLVIHGKRNGGEIKFYNQVAQGVDSWTIPYANLTLSSGETSDYVAKTNQNICVSSEYPYMLSLTDQTDSNNLLAYFAKVCKDNDRTSCKESDATKVNVKKVNIGISNEAINAGVVTDNYKQYTLSVDPNDILWFKSDNTMFPIVGQYVSTADAASRYGCDASANLIVGKAFLSRYEAVMKIQTNSVSLGFIPNEGTSSIFLIILIILGCIILAICIAIILLKVCKRKGTEDADYARAES